MLFVSIWLLSGAMDNRIPRLRGSQNSLQNNLGGENEVFMPSWLSSTGFMFMPFLLIAAGITWVTILAIEESSALAYFFGAYAAFFAYLVWLLWQQLWGSAPLLQIGPGGVNSRIMKGQTIAWEDIAEIFYGNSGKGNLRLIIKLVPHPKRHYKHPLFHTSMHPLKYVIPLGALRTSDLKRVRDVAKMACARYSTTLEQPIKANPSKQ